MKKLLGLILLSILISSLNVAAVCQGVTESYWGYVTLDDSPASIGVEVSAWVNGEKTTGDYNPFIITSAGVYGTPDGTSGFDPFLYIFGQDSYEDQQIIFKARENLGEEVYTDCTHIDVEYNCGANQKVQVDLDCDSALTDNDQDTFYSDVDCNDDNPAIYPGATEVCNGVDDDCNGATVDGVDEVDYQQQTECGVGECATTGIMDCVAASMVDTCEPLAAETEVCDGLDNDCDGSIDNDVLLTFYEDADSDGFGKLASTDLACSEPNGYVSDSTDCDDTNADIYPDAPELADGLDNDCDGQIDEGLEPEDNDGDNFTEAQGDCDDTNAAINPDALEMCNDVDDDCDGATVDGVDEVNYQQQTECGVGLCTTTGVWDCVSGSMIDTCEPLAASEEVCNGLDDDCDDLIDEDLLLTFYLDSDSDGYGKLDSSQLACLEPQGYTSDNTDCNDSNAAVNPGATEICDNDIDDDCNGFADLADSYCSGFCEDVDQDTVCDDEDNCPGVYNPDQIDLDDDGIGYACDLDTLQVEETTITIYQGWTLFALPYNPIGVDNSDQLGQAIMDEGTSCTVIMTYDGINQMWIEDILGFGDPSFALSRTAGYFISCDAQVSYTYEGVLW